MNIHANAQRSLAQTFGEDILMPLVSDSLSEVLVDRGQAYEENAKKLAMQFTLEHFAAIANLVVFIDEIVQEGTTYAPMLEVVKDGAGNVFPLADGQEHAKKLDINFMTFLNGITPTIIKAFEGDFAMMALETWVVEVHANAKEFEGMSTEEKKEYIRKAQGGRRPSEDDRRTSAIVLQFASPETSFQMMIPINEKEDRRLKLDQIRIIPIKVLGEYTEGNADIWPDEDTVAAPMEAFNLDVPKH